MVIEEPVKAASDSRGVHNDELLHVMGTAVQCIGIELAAIGFRGNRGCLSVTLEVHHQ